MNEASHDTVDRYFRLKIKPRALPTKQMNKSVIFTQNKNRVMKVTNESYKLLVCDGPEINIFLGARI